MRRQKRGVAFELKIVRFVETLPLGHRLGERIGRDVGGRRLRHHAVELGRVPAHLLGRELGGKRSAGQSGGEQADLQRGYHVDRLCHPPLFVSPHLHRKAPNRVRFRVEELSCSPDRSPLSSPPSTHRAISRRKPFAISRSEEHKSELQSLMRIPYAVFFLNKHK